MGNYKKYQLYFAATFTGVMAQYIINTKHHVISSQTFEIKL